MKRFIKVFSLIVLFVGAFFLFSSEARANFAESFTEVVDSLRGVEEEAVKIFMPQPQSVDNIVVGNRESEATTAAGVLFESSLSPISYTGNCDDNSIGMENKNHAIGFLNSYADFLNGTSDSNPGESTENTFISRKNSDVNKIKNFINNPGFSHKTQCDTYDIKWSQLNDIPRSQKVYINGVDITPGKFMSSNQVILKNDKNYTIQIEIFDYYGNRYKTSEYFVTDNTGEAPPPYIEDTGISPSFSERASEESVVTGEEEESVVTGEEIDTRAEFNPPEFNSTGQSNGNDITFTFNGNPVNVSYYKFELLGKTVYSNTPSLTVKNGQINGQSPFTFNVQLINEFGEVGLSFSQTHNPPSKGSCTSNTSWKEVNGLDVFYYDENQYIYPEWNTSPREVVFDRGILSIEIDEPVNANSIFISKDGQVFSQSGWLQDVDPNNPEWNFNISFRIPPGIDGVVEIFAEKGPGLYSKKIPINLNQFEIEPVSFNIDDPNFIPVMGSYAPYAYDNLGATQVESNFSPIDRIEDLAKVRAYKFYINGKCIGQQRAWNIIEDPELLNTIYPLGYVVLTQLPPESNLNYEITAVGFNGNESEPVMTTIVTYLEPQVELLDIGIIDTNWIVYGEYAYVYYYLSMSRQEYQKYIDDGNNVWMTVEMCCDENQRVYYPSIVFKPIPDYATCSDLTVVSRSYTDNPAFLGVKTNPGLEIIELIEGDDGSPLSFENSGGQIGDIIYSINDEDIFSEVQLADKLNNLSQGNVIQLQVGRDGVAVNLEVSLSTYPERYDIDEINESTGCFDSSGRAVGVFKIKMEEGYQKNQYVNWFQFYQRDSNAESRWPTENTMFYASNKEFNKNGNIYHGMGPGDQLASYGNHNVDFSKASFTISTNSQRSGSRPVLVASPETSDESEVSEEEVDRSFQPLEAFDTPIPKYYFELADSEYLIENNLIPFFNMATFGDCCFRNESTSESGRVFGAGAKIAYFTPEAAVLEGWNLHALTCNFVVINKEYDVDDPMYLPPSPYIPEESNLPFVTIMEQTVNLGEECQFDFGEYQQFPFYGIGVTACYTNKEGVYYCIKSDFKTFPFASWG